MADTASGDGADHDDGIDRDWVARLGPWVDVLRRRLRVDTALLHRQRRRYVTTTPDDPEPPGRVWLKWVANAPPLGAREWIADLEAMELVHLVSLAAPRAAIAVLSAAKGNALEALAMQHDDHFGDGPEGHDRQRLQLAFAVAFGTWGGFATGRFFAMAQKFIRNYSDPKYSAAFRAVRDDLMRVLGSEIPPVPIRLCIEIPQPTDGFVYNEEQFARDNNTFQQCRTLAIFQREPHLLWPERGPAHWRTEGPRAEERTRLPEPWDVPASRFRLVGFEIIPRGAVVSVDQLRLLHDIAQVGLETELFELKRCRARFLTPQSIGRTVQTALCPREFIRMRGNSQTINPGLRRLRFGDDIDVKSMAAFCSAIAESQTLRVVDVTELALSPPDAEERVMIWRWIAYALFSVDAHHRLDHVSISFPPDDTTPDELETLAAIVRASNPVHYLVSPATPSEVPPPRWVILKPDAPVRLIPPADPAPIPSEAPDVSMGGSVGLRVTLDDPDSEWIQVLLPGMGLCWVQREQVAEIREDNDGTASYVGPHERSTITSLHVVHSRGTRPAITALLELIGAPIRRLAITMDHDLDEDITRAICGLCPKLDELVLHAAYAPTLSPIITAYREGHCRARRLHVQLLRLGPPVVAFCRALGNPRHRLHEAIEDLELLTDTRNEEITANTANNADTADAEDEVRATFQALGEALARNQRLRRVFCWTDSRAIYDAYHGLIDAEDGRLISRTRAPLPMPNRLAFLSLRRRGNAPDGVSALISALDQHVIGAIFELAGTCETRRCKLVYREREAPQPGGN